MNIRQVEPNLDAKQGLPEGDRLFHFFAESSHGKTEYFVAVSPGERWQDSHGMSMHERHLQLRQEGGTLLQARG